jgi:sugar lactone lactonase YvrE
MQPWAPATKRLVWPEPPDPPRIQYLGAIDTGQALRFRSGLAVLLDVVLGKARLRLQTPHGVAVDATTLAVTDPGRSEVHLFHPAERRHRVVRRAGDTPLQTPIGAAVDGQGGVFVADSALAKVYHLDSRGRLLGEVKGEFVRPTGLAFDPGRRRLHVVDTGQHTVFTFQERDGALFLLRKLGERGDESGGFNFPTHACVDRDGNLYVTDTLNFRIQIRDPEGRLTGGFGRHGDGTGDLAMPKGVAVDSAGHIYVADTLFDVVQIFGRQGRYLLAFGGAGREEGLLRLPTGVCIDEKDRIYVADSDNSRVQVYQYLHQDD